MIMKPKEFPAVIAAVIRMLMVLSTTITALYATRYDEKGVLL